MSTNEKTVDSITEEVMSEIKAKVSHAKPKAAKKGKAKDVPANDQEQGALMLAPTPPPSNLMMVPLETIAAANQVRTEFNDETIAELAADIAKRGMLQPILLRSEIGSAFPYLIIAGERRYRAAKLAGLSHIPAIIGEATADDAEDMQLAENIQREDLSLKDLAAAVRKIYERCQSVTDTAQKVRKSKAWVSKHLAASCPDLRHMAREILEGGFTEDLEIILILDKLQRIDWCGCSDLCQKIKKGEAGRQTVREVYEAAKVKEEEAQRQRDEENTPEKKAAAVQARADQAEAWRQSRERELAERMRDPRYLCNLITQDASIVEEDRTVLTDEQREILRSHLDELRDSAAEKTDADNLRGLIRMFASGDYTEIEVAAYVVGMQGGYFDLDYLITQVTAQIEGED